MNVGQVILDELRGGHSGSIKGRSLWMNYEEVTLGELRGRHSRLTRGRSI